ncbi:MFS transporter [Pandoraea commovens]|uniref:MFS transporter n=1 Tax=Pandoraea commovens TaxID=2508289 RepID=A0ABY5QJA8_9BURK|nr:MFS transporter [Pandoraea commovens]UVA79928.1 MFS transporter [Pandoraea commovens]
MQTTPAGTPVIDPALRRKAVIGSTLGNAFEWFDFTVYGLFAVVIAKLFFPADNDTTSLLASVASLGVAFFFRPIGGLAFGLYADRAGRKSALSVMVLLMALGTGLIGIAPTYATIGFAAPLLILLARVIQGFSAGGEFGGSTAMLIEFSPPNLRGFYGSFQMCSQALAVALAGLCAYVLTTGLSKEALESWGWRLPFLFGILIGPVGFYIRRRMTESPEFLAYAATREPTRRTPLADVFSKHYRSLIAGFGLTVAATTSFYVTLIYTPIYAVKQLGLTQGSASLSTFISAMLIAALCPLTGWISDRVGRKPLILLFVLLYGLTSFWMFTRLHGSPSMGNLLLAQILPAVCMGFVWGAFATAVTEVFPVGVRSTGVSILYNVSVMLFGGLAPFWITYLIKVTQNPLAPAYYILMTVAISLVTYGLLGREGRNMQASTQHA